MSAARTDSSPVISVVVPIYNGAQYLREAIDSVLQQTFTSLEILLVDDGSTDETPEILRSYVDCRVRHFRHDNRGLAATLNRGIELARGRYIARQDQDDISHPRRLECQIAYLERNPACGLVGTWAEIHHGDMKTGRSHQHPTDNSALQYALLIDNPFVHSSVVIRKSVLDVVGAYSTDRSRQPPEDYELWSRIARNYEVANIPEFLHSYREVATSMSRTGNSPFLDRVVSISAENISLAAGAEQYALQVVNIPSLAHSALHRVKQTPNFGVMTQIFCKATERVVASSERARFRREAEHFVRGLEERYSHLYGTNKFLSRVRRFARRGLAALRRAH